MTISRKLLIPALQLAVAAMALSCGVSVPFYQSASALYSLESGTPVPASRAAGLPGVYGTFQGEWMGNPQSISFIRISPKRYALTVVSAEGPQADSTAALVRRVGGVAGINGSYFNMRQLTNTTFVKDDGTDCGDPVESEAFRTNGAVLIRGGEVRFDAVDTFHGWDGAQWQEVLAAGPVLLDEGRAATYSDQTEGWAAFYDKRHPRSFVGKDAAGYLWLVVVDGRFRGKAAGMKVAELTELARQMGMTDALNLDGGGSATLWTEAGGTISHPTDNRRYDGDGQRRVPNILAVLKR